jgi:dolichol-phosphate mannosyltransferase
MSDEFLLAIPVFNEENSIVRVLERARSYCRDILVINDGSTDRTPELLRTVPSVQVLTHLENRGYGKSLADAFDFARRRGYRWVITMDADEQHEAARIPRFRREAREDDADIISGTRYPDGWEVEDYSPPNRRRINRILTARLNRVCGLALTDAFCGFKAYRTEALSGLHLTVPGYALPIQLWVQAARLGLRIREVPVRLIYPDPNRHFGGLLDDPEVRLKHYLSVLREELSADRSEAAAEENGCRSCR